MFVGVACVQPSGSNGGGGGGVFSGSSAVSSGAGSGNGAISVSDIAGPTGFPFPKALVGGTPSSHTFTVTNNGTADATGLTYSLSLSVIFAFPSGFPGGGSCRQGGTLSPGQTCTFTVQFAPSANRSYLASINLAFNYSGRYYTSVNLISGTAASPAQLSATPISLNFGQVPVTEQLSKTVTVGVAGVAAQVASISITSGGANYSIASDGCGPTPSTISTSCDISIQLVAPGAPGVVNGNLRLTYNDGLTPGHTLDIALVAQAVAEADHFTFSNPVPPLPSMATTTTPLTFTIQAIDTNGANADYLNGTIRLMGLSLSTDSAAATIVPSTALMVNGRATFNNTQITSIGLYALRAFMNAGDVANGWQNPLNGLSTSPGHDSNQIAVSLLSSSGLMFANSLLYYLPFDTNLGNAQGASIGAYPQFVPNFGFHAGPWVPSYANGAVDTLAPYERDAMVLGDTAYLRYSTGSGMDARSASANDALDHRRGTISLWLQPGWNGSDKTHRHLFVSANTGAPLLKIAPDASNSNKLTLWAGRYGINETDLSVDISGWATGSWHHIVLRWDAYAFVPGSSSHMVLSVDNTPQAGVGQSWSPGTPGPQMRVGTGYNDASAGGAIAGFVIDDRAWTDAEVSDAYNSGVGRRSVLTANSKLAVSGNLGSLSGLRPYVPPLQLTNGTMSNYTDLPVASASTYFNNNDMVTVVAANAWTFNGNTGTSYMDLGAHSEWDFGTGDFTIEAWVRQKGSNQSHGYQTVFSKGSSCGVGSPGFYRLSVADPGNAFIFVCDDSGNQMSMSGVKNMKDGHWHHLAAVVDRSTTHKIHLYVDGVADGTAVAVPSGFGNVLPAGAHATMGGDSGGSTSFYGDIDGVRVWSTALDGPTLSQNRARRYYFDSGSATQCVTNLVGYWEADNQNGAAANTDICHAYAVTNHSVDHTSDGVMGYNQGSAAGDQANGSCGSVSCIHAMFINTGTVSSATGTSATLTSGTNMSQLWPNAQVQKIYDASGTGAPYNLVVGGDFESMLHNVQPMFAKTVSGGGYEYAPAAVWIDTTSPLSGYGSLHVLTDQPCVGGEDQECPVVGRSGVYVSAYTAGHVPPGYLLSFDYQVLSGTVDINLGNGQDHTGAPGFLGYNFQDGAGNSLVVTATPQHFESVYEDQSASALNTNLLYFSTNSATGQFLLDNLKLLPLLLANDFEAGIDGWTIDPTTDGDASCSALTTAGGGSQHRGGGSLSLQNCDDYTAILSNSFSTNASKWYAATLQIWNKSGDVRVDAIDAGGKTLATAFVPNQGAAGTYKKTTLAFQAGSANSSAQLRVTYLTTNSPAAKAELYLDDVGVYQIDSSVPVDAAPLSTLTKTGVYPPAQGNYYVYPAGVAEGRVACGAVANGDAAMLGPGSSCAPGATMGAACSGGRSPNGGTTDGAVLIDGNSTLAINMTDLKGGALTSDWTISFWMKPRKALTGSDYTRGQSPILSMGSAGYSYNPNFSLWNLSSALRTLTCLVGVQCTTDPFNTGSWTASKDLTPAASSAWTHVMVTYANGGPQTLTIYKNAGTVLHSTYETVAAGGSLAALTGSINLGGVSQAVQAIGSGSLENQQIMLPDDPSAASPYPVETFDGWIDNFRVFNRVLNQQERLAVCQTEQPQDATWNNCGM